MALELPIRYRAMVHSRDVPALERQELLPVSAADSCRNRFRNIGSIGVDVISTDFDFT